MSPFSFCDILPRLGGKADPRRRHPRDSPAVKEAAEKIGLGADDVEPDKEAVDLDTQEVGEGAVVEHPRDTGLEVGEVLEGCSRGQPGRR
jgi:hypothetical protein